MSIVEFPTDDPPAGPPPPSAGRSLDQHVDLLAHLIDLRRPGAAERGRRLADAALRLAQRFEVPSQFLPDLWYAARLHEIGLAAERTDPADSGWLDPCAWRSLVVAARLLSQVDALRPAGELIGAIGEHWDGSGFPHRRQRGQIPLRSRLLRVLIDFFAGCEPAPDQTAAPERVLVAMHPRTGTRYDPAVMAHLEALVSTTPELGRRATKRRVPLEALTVGAILADDLRTSSGVKLMSAGAVITPGSLEVIRRRDANDPVIDGAWIVTGIG